MRHLSVLFLLALTVATPAQEAAAGPEILSVEFRESPAHDVLQFLREITGWNILVEGSVAERLDQQVITLVVDGVSPTQLLQLICELLDLRIVADGDVRVLTQGRRQPRELRPPPVVREPEQPAPGPPEVIEVLQDIDPVLVEEIQRLRQVDPTAARRALALHRQELRELIELRGRDTRQYERAVLDRRLDRRAHQLARELRADPPAGERVRLQDTLLGVIEELLDLRLQRMEDRLARARADLDEAQRNLTREEELLERRRSARADLIEERYRELLGERDLHRW